MDALFSAQRTPTIPALWNVVNADLDVYARSYRVIPPQLEDVGIKAVRAFNVRERFFHIEFIHSEPDDTLGRIGDEYAPTRWTDVGCDQLCK